MKFNDISIEDIQYELARRNRVKLREISTEELHNELLRLKKEELRNASLENLDKLSNTTLQRILHVIELGALPDSIEASIVRRLLAWRKLYESNPCEAKANKLVFSDEEVGAIQSVRYFAMRVNPYETPTTPHYQPLR